MSVPEPSRLRLIPARGRNPFWHAYDPADARAQAQAYAQANGVGVLVCDAPVGGLVRRLYLVRPPRKAKAA